MNTSNVVEGLQCVPGVKKSILDLLMSNIFPPDRYFVIAPWSKCQIYPKKKNFEVQQPVPHPQ